MKKDNFASNRGEEFLPDGPSEHDVQVRSGCLNHAHSLLKSAEILLEAGQFNHSYHMSVLALEEIGKLCIYEINAMCRIRNQPNSISDSHLEDHVAKIYWGFLLHILTEDGFSPERFQALQGTAKIIHERRLDAIYVNTFETPFVDPGSLIKEDDATRIYSMASIQFQRQIDQAVRCREFIIQMGDALTWLLTEGMEPECQLFIRSEESFNQLLKLKNYPDWIVWLRSAYKAELHRFDYASAGQEGPTDVARWKISVKFEFASCVPSKKSLRTWNQQNPQVQIRLNKSKGGAFQVVADFVLGRNLRKEIVHCRGLEMAERLMLAWSIASQGVLWWDDNTRRQKYHERFEDMESNCAIETFDKSYAMDVDHQNLMSEIEMDRMRTILYAMPWPDDSYRFMPFSLYLRGAGLLSMASCYFQLELEAFVSFYEAFWLVLERFIGAEVQRNMNVFCGFLNGFSETDNVIRNLFSIGDGLLRGIGPTEPVSSQGVLAMKRAVDFVIISMLAGAYVPGSDSS